MSPASIVLLLLTMSFRLVGGLVIFCFAAFKILTGHRQKYVHERRPWDLPGVGSWKKR